MKLSKTIEINDQTSELTIELDNTMPQIDWNNVWRPEKKTFTFDKPKDSADLAMQAFLKGDTKGRFGTNYFIDGNILIYKKIVYGDVKANVIAKRIGQDVYLGNSSILSLVGSHMSFGHHSQNYGVTSIQTRLSQYVPMIPFNVFQEAELDMDKIRIIARGPEETLVIKEETKWNDKTGKQEYKDVKRHYTGSSLFEIQDRYFLFDVDRRELRNKIFNAFLVELPCQASSIAQAYELLKPKEVKDAEKKGLKILRQGEWFFIPVKGEFDADKEDSDNRRAGQYKRIELRAGESRPNYASKGNEKLGLVTGKVEHSGREHAELKLDGWFKPVPNTATKSFTIKGDID
jgi:hypothetical protein